MSQKANSSFATRRNEHLWKRQVDRQELQASVVSSKHNVISTEPNREFESPLQNNTNERVNRNFESDDEWESIPSSSQVYCDEWFY